MIEGNEQDDLQQQENEKGALQENQRSRSKRKQLQENDQTKFLKEQSKAHASKLSKIRKPSE